MLVSAVLARTHVELLRASWQAEGMASMEQLTCAEADMRRLLEREGLAAPDEVEYWDKSVVLLWHDTKCAVVIEVTEPPEGVGRAGLNLRQTDYERRICRHFGSRTGK